MAIVINEKFSNKNHYNSKEPSTLLNSDKIVQYLKTLKPNLAQNGIINIGLFGSWAKGKNGFFSDIDIFIETSDKFFENFQILKALEYIENLKKQLSKHFGRLVDLVDIAKMPQDKKENFLTGAIYA